MAEASISIGEDQFMCPVCLDLLKDPVTIPCGHSYCMGCIKGCWDQDDQKGVYSCPQCRETFTPRPVLHKNTLLAVVEKLKKTGLQAAAPPAHCDSGDVECDFCIGKKEKAVKSCLTCLVSFCQTHLQPHYEVTALQKHTLVKASTRLQDKICQRHNKLIELCEFEDVGKSVSQLKEQLEGFCKNEFGRLSSQLTNTDIIPLPEPKTREQFLQYSCDLTLDPNTAHEELCLSEGNRVVTRSNTVQSYPDHPERFDYWRQVLCRESVSERCYWETEWSGDYGVYISVSCKDIRRKGWGYECRFGRNYQSWGLYCPPSKYSCKDNDKVAKHSIVPSSSRIGVYVDHRAGTLSFYSVSDTMTLLHRVHTTFTQPLYPGFGMTVRAEVHPPHQRSTRHVNSVRKKLKEAERRLMEEEWSLFKDYGLGKIVPNKGGPQI
ncbi:tripartite motif-containing protein 16-like [Chanos chanos]|uniref:Tripartite motif-containing protein 16-like n=1 Tax=Chanos chanos TaxID=29144 RepID=A0A6J2VQA5_CHACN|nr:tripartite motif-containing protein 16-like [Chanos chanos]